MTSNTQLGKAVRDAVRELDALAALERETLVEADALLKKLGLKSSLFDGEIQVHEDEDAIDDADLDE